MVNLYHTDDPTQHICEIQFCLHSMLGVRQRLGGHKDFNRFRGSAEVIEMCHYEHLLLSNNCSFRSFTREQKQFAQKVRIKQLCKQLCSRSEGVRILIPATA